MSEKSEKKSQRRFENNVASLDEQRTKMLEKGNFSLPSGLGKLVIIASKDTDSDNIHITPEQQTAAFMEEAEQLQESMRVDHQEVIVSKGAHYQDISMHIKDPEVTDVVLIGHGNLGSFWLDGGGKIGWKDMQHENKGGLLFTDRHLKLGQFIQRICGHLPVRTVPLGAPIVADLTKIIAPLGETIPDISPDESLFKPVFKSNDDFKGGVLAMNEIYKHQREKKK